MISFTFNFPKNFPQQFFSSLFSTLKSQDTASLMEMPLPSTTRVQFVKPTDLKNKIKWLEGAFKIDNIILFTVLKLITIILHNNVYFKDVIKNKKWFIIQSA